MIAKYMLSGAAVIASLSMLWIAYTYAHPKPQINSNFNTNRYIDMWGHDK